MRTTLTLDPDVVARLKSEMRRSGASFKELVNQYLRRALNTAPATTVSEPFRVEPRDLGLRAGLDYAHVSDLLEQIEGPLHR